MRNRPTSCAIATLAIGEAYLKHYRRIFYPSVQRYADRHRYDLLIFEDFLAGDAFRHGDYVTFMKHLIPLQDDVLHYDQLMVLDADVIVNASAPPFDDLATGDGIGVVDEWHQLGDDVRRDVARANGWEESPREYYKLAGLVLDTDTVINSGMFVCSPSLHGAFFRGLVDRHLEARYQHPRGPHYEQAAFGHALQEAGLARFLPYTWNRIWPLHRAAFVNRTATRMDLFQRFLETQRESFMLHMTAHQDHDFAFAIRNMDARSPDPAAGRHTGR